MIRTNRRIRDLFTAISALALVGIMLALLVSPAQAAGPTVPTELRATALWAGIIDVQWSAVSEADSYQLQLWSDAASRWKDLPTDGVEVAYYGAGAIVRGLPESSTSWYRVRAVNSHGASDWSEFLAVDMTGGPTAWADVPEPTNVAATGAPAISGDLQVADILTVDTSGIADANGLERVEFRYQWLANDGGTYSEIDGATEPAYILTRKEAGKTVRVRVSFTDRHGFAESATSAATEPVPIPENSVAKGAPLITGRPWVHGTLTADTSGIVDADGLENVAYSYQWLSSGDTEIEGATSSTYSLQTADEGKTIRVRVSFTDDAGNDESLTSAATDTVAVRANSPATGAPTISGTAQVGQTLTVDTSGIADADGVTNASYGGTWYANDTEGRYATGQGGYVLGGKAPGYDLSYTVSRGAVGKTVKIEVYFTDDAGNREWLASAKTGVVTATTPAAPENVTASLTASGDLVLSWEVPTWDPMSEFFGEQTWGDGGSAITGYVVQWKEASSSWDTEADVSEATVTGTTHTIRDLTSGTEYTARVIAVNSVGRGSPSDEASVTTNTPATGTPTISGTAQVGQTLTASTSGISDTDGLINVIYSYQWLSSRDTEIEGATSSTYSLQTADEGKTIRVRVSFTDDAGNEETLTSAATAAVAAKSNSPASGLPTISGTTQVDETLSADTSDIADPDGLGSATFSYQWIRNYGTNDYAYISGATGPTYTLVSHDAGKTIQVLVSFTDGADNEETLTSTPTETVDFAVQSRTVNTPATGQPTIVGTPRVGERLTVDLSSIADEDGLENAEYDFVWFGDYSTERQGGRLLADTAQTTLPVPEFFEFVVSWLAAGTAISVQVYFTDDAGNYERLTSEPTEVVPGPLKGFSLMDTTDQSVVATLTYDSEVILDDPANGSYGARVDLAADAQVGSVRLDFSYGQYVRTDNSAPYSLYGEDANGLLGEGLPAGTYYLSATAFSESDQGGDPLQILVVRFTVAEPNSPSTGAPTIVGTPQVGQTLTADTSGIADADGLENVAYSYQWLSSRDTEIEGATSSTYSLQTADEGKTIRVRVSFTDDAGNDETLTSAATAEVEVPLTAELRNVPDNHDGQNAFTFRILFSEDITVGYQALKEDAFEISDGTITRARRVNGRDDLRQFTVRPSSDAAVVLVLKADRPCGDDGAICTSDGKRLSNRLELTVPGPAGVNTPATGAPTISGTARVGQSLAASTSGIADSDGLVNATFSYQWLADDADISGATGSTYTLDAADEGRTVKVRVSFTDDAGNEETLTSAATGAVEARSNSPATGGPTISDEAQVGETLTADTSGIADADGLTNAKFRYQWLADDADISGATGSTYTLGATEEGKAIKVRVSFTDDGGNEESLTSAPTAMVSTPLTAGFQWMPGSHNGRDEFTIFIQFSEEIASSYVTLRDHALTVTGGEVVSADVFGYSDLWGLVIDPDGNGDVTIALPITTDCSATGAVCTGGGKKLSNHIEHTVSGPVHANSVATGIPTITGTAQVGETLTAGTSAISDEDGLTNATFSYQWIRNDGGVDTEIQGATDSTYTLDHADAGKTVKVRVSFTDDAGNEETLASAPTVAVEARSNSPATGVPTVSGEAQVGETLTAHTSGISDEDGLDSATFTYQWMADDADIGGATGSAYTLVDADVGRAIRVRVSFTDDAGSEETLTSAATAEVAARPNSPPTGAPTISGTSRVDETLSADTTAIADTDGLASAPFSYQWLAGGTDIDGATGSSHTLTASEEGKTIKVRVSFTDDAGNEESVTSEATAAVEAKANSPATGAPTISGTPQVDEALTADTSGIADEDGLDNATFSYQWLAGGSDIDGATGSGYNLTSSEQGQTIQVRVSFTDDGGNQESLTSTATGVVAGAPPPLTVSLANNPASHNGTDVFTFEIRFSEEPEADFSYQTLKFHAFSVTGGSVKKAQRMDKPSNIPWLITVRPDSNGDVTIMLPATTDCGDQGAVCAGDGRKLSNRLEFTVSGPGQ